MKRPLLRQLIILSLLTYFFTPAYAYAADPIKSAIFAGQCPYHPSKAIAIDSNRNLVFLGDGDSINILDTDLNLISSFSATNSSQIGGLFYSENDSLLYIACRTDGFKIYNVSNIENPVKIISYQPDSFETVNVFIDDSKAYLSSGIDGMIILDISDATNPVLLSKSTLPGGFGLSYAIDIYASGTYAFAADLYNGIHIVDISTPQEPDYIKGIVLAGASDIAISEDFLYTTLQGNGMAILDISTPENTYVSSVFATGDIETSVRVSGSFAYVSCSSIGIRVLDITNKTEPFYNSEWTYTESGGSSIGLLHDKNAVFFANDQTGLQKIDISDMTDIKSLASFDTPADAVAIAVSGNYIYSVDNMVDTAPEKEGLRINQLSTYSKAVQFNANGFIATPGTANDVYVSDDYAYIADGSNGLQIINIKDKKKPALTGNYDTLGLSTGIFKMEIMLILPMGIRG